MWLDEKHIAKLRSWTKEKLETAKVDASSKSVSLVVECIEKDLSTSDAEAKLEKLVGRSEIKHFVERLYQRAKRYSEESRDSKRKHEPEDEDGKKRPKLDDARDDKRDKAAPADERGKAGDRAQANGSDQAATRPPAGASASAPEPAASQASSSGAAAGADGSGKTDGQPEKRERKKRRWDEDSEPAKPPASMSAVAAALPSTSQISALVSSITAKVLQPKKAGDGDAAPSGAEAPAKPNLAEALAAVEKAKQAALLQKKIQDQLKAMQAKKDGTAAPSPPAAPSPTPAAIPGGASTIAAAAAAAQALALNMKLGAIGPMGRGFVPPPLIVDKEGREIDATGKVVTAKPQVGNIATLKANIVRKKLAAFKVEAPKLETDREKNPFYDPRMPVAPAAARTKRTFRFVEPGTFVKRAEHMRARALADELYQEKREAEREEREGPAEGAVGDANLVPVGSGALAKQRTDPKLVLQTLPPALLEFTPEVEWWDEPVLASGSYDDIGEDGSVKLNEANVTIYIQHPIPIEPPTEPKAPPIRPLMLTAKERKKLRKRNRAEAEKEKQDQVKLGLIPAPEPKLKLSNMMKILGSQAVADPTQMEKKVREQVAARQKTHEDANAARKLSKEERTEKTVGKLLAGTSVEVHVALFRVTSLEHKQHKYKVDINAQQNMLTGCAVLREGCAAVVVEGGLKSIKRYSRLMLKRIDWTSRPAAKEGEEEEAEEEEAAERRRAANRCVLVWQGTALKRAFDKFRFESCKTDADAKSFLARFGVEHYWDMARNYQEPE